MATTPKTKQDDSHTAFFYGTLMAPQVLHRVCHGSMDPSNPIYSQHNLAIKPAVLPSFQRHRVKDADYPAILPTPSQPESAVRGTLVTGLSDADMWRLDIFEGDEYERRVVRPRLLTMVGAEDGSGEGNVEGEVMEAETYVWVSGEQRLEMSREWDFGEFQREKMRYWVGSEGASDGIEGREDINEVDEAVAAQQKDGTGGRGLNGHISSALKQAHGKDEELGNAA